MKKFKVLLLTATSFLMLIAAVLFTAPAAAERAIKIGVILPITGDMAAVGTACRDAVRMAFDEHAGGSTNYQFIFEDDRLMPTEVAKAAQKLISVDKVSAIISTWSYGGRIVAPLAQRAKIPHIGMAWDILVANGDYNFIHLTPPSEFMRSFLEAFKKLGVTRVALLGIEESGSVYALDEFVRMAPEYKIEVVYRDSLPWEFNDFNSIVTKISKVNPQYLLVNIGGGRLIAGLLQALKTQQTTFKVTAATSFDVTTEMGALEGAWYVSDSYIPDDIVERFTKKYHHTIRYGIGNFYEAARLLMYAFDKSAHAKAEEAKDVLQAIREMPSVFGPTSANNDGVFTYMPQYMRIRNGRREPIQLADINS